MPPTPTTQVKDIATVSTGATLRSKVEVAPSGNVRLIQMKDLGDDNLVHLSSAVRVDFPNPKPSYQAQAGDIIFRSRGRTSTAALLTEPAHDAVVAGPLLRVRPEASLVLPQYLLWWINQPFSQRFLASRAEGSVMPMISKRELENLQVALPSLEQQSKIAKVYDLCMREQRLMEKIKQLKLHQTQQALAGLAYNGSTVATQQQGKREIKMPRGKNQHVVPHPDGWAVKSAGSGRATKVMSTQGEAIKVAEGIAKNQGSDTKIHSRRGKIRAGNSYGNDPNPPKDKK